MGRADAGGLRVLGQALSEVHAPEDVQASGVARRPAGGVPRSDDALLDALARPNDADLDEFRRGIDPLASPASSARCSRSFRRASRTRRRRATTSPSCCRRSPTTAVAVELRHRSWSDRIGETLALLNGFGAAWVQIDEPKFRFSIRQNYLPNVKGFYYMRLHGRNAAKWWRHEKSEDRYNYLYSADELKEFSETADAARQLVKKLYLYTNNHFSAKSVANAAMIKQQLGEPIEGEYPPEFVAALSGAGGRRRRHRARRRSTPITRAVLANHARTAARIDRPADVLPPRHEIQVDVRPPAARACPCRAPARSPRACGSAPSQGGSRCGGRACRRRCSCRLLNDRISTRFAVFRPTPGSVSSSSIVSGTRPLKRSTRIRHVSLTCFALWR